MVDGRDDAEELFWRCHRGNEDMQRAAARLDAERGAHRGRRSGRRRRSALRRERGRDLAVSGFDLALTHQARQTLLLLLPRLLGRLWAARVGWFERLLGRKRRRRPWPQRRERKAQADGRVSDEK